MWILEVDGNKVGMDEYETVYANDMLMWTADKNSACEFSLSDARATARDLAVIYNISVHDIRMKRV